MPTDDARLRRIRDSLLNIGRLSDNLVRLGPFRLGLDGVLSWIPGVGEAYSAAAAAFILAQGVRARAPAGVLIAAGALLALRTTITAIPLAGPIASDMFTAHRWAAALIARAIERKLADRPASAEDGSTLRFADA